MSTSKQRSCSDYHVAWICPVADIELLPARLMLDEEHPTPPYDTHYDDNTYICGKLCGHNVVVATCPQGETGNVNAGRLTGSLFKTFPSIRMAVLVGIGGGIPRSEISEDALENIHLGDVVVGWPGDGKPACVYHDRGRSKVDGQFELVGTMGNPDWRLLNALSVLASDNEIGETKFEEQLARLQRVPKTRKKFMHPGVEHDKLFKAAYHHAGDYKSRCQGCDPTELLQRPQRTSMDNEILVFHQGRIATGNGVIQDGQLRDEIRARCAGALCVEMEAAGVDVNRQCLVVRGISDYADSHKSDLWRTYAAGRAAAFTRELLSRVQPAVVWEMEVVLRAQMLDLPLAQGQANEVQQSLDSSQHTSTDRTIRARDDKAESISLLKMSVKMFQKHYRKEGLVQGDTAARMLGKLASTLKCISTKTNQIAVEVDSRMEVPWGFEHIDPKDMKRFRNIIKSSQSVSLNTGAARFEVAGDGKLIQKRSTQIANVQGHELAVTLIERSSLLRNRRAVHDKQTDTIAKIQIKETSGERAVITAYMHYKQGPVGSQILNPTISIGKTLPLDSLLFTVVKNGDVNQLRHLLMKGRATLRDRDEHGTPLLHHAMKQPKMCKFLIENGVDLDELARGPELDDELCVPIMAYPDDYDESDEEVLQRRIKCKILLLEAGADPTIPWAQLDLIESLSSHGARSELLANIIDKSGPFFDPNRLSENRETLLTNMAMNMGFGYFAESFAVLLDRGADIHARNRWGRTALHTAVLYLRRVLQGKEELRALALLIERGANIHTSDLNGRSIFEDAYECDHDRPNGMGSYRGDLWDHVLIRCGYGEHIWPPEERIYHYTKNYTEEHFKSLWEGWEHLLPYPDGTSSRCSVILYGDEDYVVEETDEVDTEEYESDEEDSDEDQNEGEEDNEEQDDDEESDQAEQDKDSEKAS